MDLYQSPGFLVNQLAHLMQVELDRLLNEYGVTTSQWAVLALLWNKEGLSHLEIQQALRIEKATVTGLIQRMMRTGLIYREVDSSDKRVHRVFLTEKGKSLEHDLIPQAKAVNEKMLRGISDEHAKILMQCIHFAIRNMEQN